MSEMTEDREKSKTVGPLRGLFPFLAPYRIFLVAALAALIMTAGLSLALPIAVRRVVDGFSVEQASQMDAYFGAAIGIAALLAIFTGLRFYLVTRLGERVVADIRSAVYARVIGMSPAFFERVLTGEVLSRLTTDTTLIQSVIGSSVSVALRNVLRIAESSGSASETLLAAQTVQAYTHEAQSRVDFGNLTELAFDAAKARVFNRSIMTVIVIFLIFTGIVGVLWVGARDVRSESMTPGELVQFLIYAIMVAGAVASLSETWGALQSAAGATERLNELLTSWMISVWKLNRDRRWRWSGHPERERRRFSNCFCGSLILMRGRSLWTVLPLIRWCGRRCAKCLLWSRKSR